MSEEELLASITAMADHKETRNQLEMTNYRHVSPDIMAAALKGDGEVNDIIPAPKPDPLVEIFEAWFGNAAELKMLNPKRVGE